MAREPGKSERPDASMEAAEYVLGVMSAQERQDFARRLREDEALRADVVYWENELSSLASETAAVTPPAHVQKALEQKLFGVADAKPVGLWQSLGFWRGLSFASLAAATVLAGVLFNDINRSSKGNATLIAELTGESKTVRLAIAYDADQGQLRVNRIEGNASAGRVFELWLIEGGNAPVSLGLLPDDQEGKITIPETLRTKLPNAVLAISDEPTGGSPTGAPTGAVLATGQVLTVS